MYLAPCTDGCRLNRFFDDFSARKNNKSDGSRSQIRTTRSRRVLGFKAIWAFYYLYLPFKYSPHNDSYAKLFALWTLTEFTTGWLLAFMFQVAHVTPDVEFFKVDEKTGVISSNKSWAEAQLASSADFAHGSKFWTHFSGGLNYQVIHHLFPGVCHVHYPQLAPLVMDVCKKRGLEYIVYPTFWALCGAFRRNVGGGAFKVPFAHRRLILILMITKRIHTYTHRARLNTNALIASRSSSFSTRMRFFSSSVERKGTSETHETHATTIKWLIRRTPFLGKKKKPAGKNVTFQTQS